MPKVVFRPHLLFDVEHWRKRAVEARTVAGGFSHPSAKKTMLDIADGYDQLAELSEWSLEHVKPLIDD
jgi:hypothetical protein